MNKFSISGAFGIEEGVDFKISGQDEFTYRIVDNVLMYYSNYDGNLIESELSMELLRARTFAVLPPKQYTTIEMIDEMVKSNWTARFKSVKYPFGYMDVKTLYVLAVKQSNDELNLVFEDDYSDFLVNTYTIQYEWIKD